MFVCAPSKSEHARSNLPEDRPVNRFGFQLVYALDAELLNDAQQPHSAPTHLVQALRHIQVGVHVVFELAHAAPQRAVPTPLVPFVSQREHLQGIEE